jgi:alpha-L-fucosidase
MKRRLALVGTLAVVLGAMAPSRLRCQAAPPDASPNGEDRLAWFRHDKFGLFIHWGPYSLLAGEWKGQRVPVGTEAEWIMERFSIPVGEYREMARQMNPANFNADQWVRLAKAAGMKYLVITAKHHDGFAMYHSAVSQYNIVDWTPFKRDPLKELSDACQKAGIRFCVYYSHREDWDHPDAYGNNWDYDETKKNFERYLEQKSKPQLRELLTNYGPLGLVWFDRGLYTPQQAQSFVELVHSLQPRCLISGRVGNYGQDLMGDYQDMGDNGMPVGGVEEAWESPQTLNTTWGYSKFDHQWKTPANVIERLVEIVSKGGNYLLNIGPMADGTIPPATVATLEKVGAWMQKNGESIYGTSACPLTDFPWGRCTVKGQKVYLHVFSWPGDATLRIAGLHNDVVAAYPLLAPSQRLALGRENDALTITLPAKSLDEYDTVVVMEIVGPPQVDAPLVAQDGDFAVTLDYLEAVTAGKAIKRFNREGGFHISKWTGPADRVTWRMLVRVAGTYQVSVRYAAPKEWARSEYVVTVGAQSLTGAVEPTDGWFQYRGFDLGTVSIPRAGEYTVSIRPAAESEHSLMYFQSLVLEPVATRASPPRAGR